MRSGPVILTALAMIAPGAGHAAEWYTGAPGSQPAPTAYISAFPPQTDPVYTPLAPVSKSNGYVGAPTPKETFGAAIDFAVTADSKGSRFATAIATIAPFSGMDESGLRVRLGGVIGQYSYNKTLLGSVKGTQTDLSLMVGYEWVMPRLTFGVYGGGNYDHNSIDRYDPDNASIGKGVGMKVALDFNYRPTDLTMFSGVASYSTMHSAYYARLKAGYAFAPQLYVGPEAIFMGDDFFSQWRLGLHMTGAKFGMLQVGASAGVMVDRVRGSGLYGILDARVGF
ncbi:MAG: cellulose biosynthesis protein BcsS [Rhodoblastus sp.]